MANDYDLVVIGGGPGGYTAAIRGAQLGLRTACVEVDEALGGTCLRVGCIPSKVLLEASERFHMAESSLGAFGVEVSGVKLDLSKMLARKDSIVRQTTRGVSHLFKKNDVTRYLGRGRMAGGGRVIVEGDDGTTELSAKHVIIATGSNVAPLRGVELDGDRIGTSTEALAYPEVPGKLVVIGAGYIGLELGSVWSRLGAKVIVLEYLDRILPGMDSEIAKDALKIFKRQGLEFRLGSRVTSAKRDGGGCVVEVEGAEAVTCDRVLVAVGRVPNTEGLGLEDAGVDTDDRGRIAVDEHFATSASGVYAIGDVIEGPMLAHKAEDEGVACVERIVTGYGHVNYGVIPGIVYTDPEIATVGKSEEELRDADVEYKKGSFPFTANGRAKALGSTEGRVKVLADAKTDRVLGVHIIGPRAGDLIAEAAAAMEFGASSEDIARTCHAHPTLSEALREAALDVAGRAINF
jgi:dihydrolipoamide dehydrogenase